MQGFFQCGSFLRRIRCPLLGVDAVFVGGIVDPAHGIDVTAGIPVLLEVLLGVIPGNIGAGGKADRKLAVAVCVDVLGMVALEDVCAGSLPAAGSQRQAEGAGVAVGDPRKLCAIPLGVLEGGVGTGTLHKAADAPLELRRAVFGGVHHLGDFAVAGRFCRFCRRNRHTLGSGQSVVHLAGKLCTALAVPGDEGVRIGDQGFPVSGAVLVKVRLHLLGGFLVQPGKAGYVVIPRCRCDLHCPSPSKAAAPAPAAPAP